MQEWDRQSGERASAWLTRLRALRLPPTATRSERDRLTTLRRCARQAVRRARASDRLRAVFQALESPEKLPETPQAEDGGGQESPGVGRR